MTQDPRRDPRNRERRSPDPRNGDAGYASQDPNARNRARRASYPIQRPDSADNREPGVPVRVRPSSQDGRRNSGRPSAASSESARQRKKRHVLPAILLVLFLSAVLLFSLWAAIGHGTPAPVHPTTHTNAGSKTGDDTPIATKKITINSDTSLPLSGKIILLDPGHGGSDPGAGYPSGSPTYIESNINLALAEQIRDSLTESGATVILLREDDTWVSLYRRVALAHLYAVEYAQETGSLNFSLAAAEDLTEQLESIIRINTDTPESGGMGIMSGTGVGSDLEMLFELEAKLPNILYVSVHCNANDYSSLHGTQVYYVTDDAVITSEDRLVETDPSYQNNADFPLRDPYYGRDGEKNARLAQDVYDGITAAAPEFETNAAATVAENFAVLREHGMSGILIETGFLTNAKDRAYLTDDEVTSRLAQGVTDGCIAFFAE